VVLFVFGAAGAIGGLVILAGVLAGGPADDDLVCNPEPTACATVRDYAEAFNSGNASRVQELVSERFMRVRLDSESEAQLRARFDALEEEQKLEEFRITVVSAGEEEAFVTARFVVDSFETESKYALIKQDGQWLIDR
jgi:hypothetical protein